MLRVSNSLIALLNLLGLVASIPVLTISLWLRKHAINECERTLGVPLMVLGIILFFLSLVGLIGSCCRVSSLLWLYLFLTFLIILSLFVFSFFAIAVTSKGAGKAVPGTGIKDHKLGDYSKWLQENVVDGHSWVKIKSCLIQAQVCGSLRNDHLRKASVLYRMSLSPLESGCCKPPIACGFIYKNATFWVPPKSGPAVPDDDCTTWSNNQQILCIDCKSCKAGVLASLKNDWRKLAILNICVMIFLLIVYSVGQCALKNITEDGYKRYRPFQ
ncbi:tetraspanin-8-like [Macadamia integrifolia]|uniref:tetraspanin-8-like n=1 Tax=Macadamia integrifolia TaxID=60698 RepID=UPI001C4E3BF5|nr:tetraspanin-8-like [Macadamia integrifolia]